MNKIKLQIKDIGDGGKHILVKCSIEGHRAFLLIDTGASNSIFDFNFIGFDKENISPVDDDVKSSGFNSPIEDVHVGEISLLKIGHFKTKIEKAVFTSLEHINSLYKEIKLPQIAGIIGSDFLVKHKAIIDFYQELLFLQKFR